MSEDTIIFIILTSISVFLLLNNLRLQIKNKKIMAKSLQDSLDKSTLIQNLSDRLVKIEQKPIEESEGFIKFLSESRDWAFKYIEDVQKALTDFKNIVEPKLKYANTYGTVAGPTAHLTLIEEITLAYIDLKKIMPDEDLDQDVLK